MQATFEPQFMKQLSNTDAELKKRVAYNKSVYLLRKNPLKFLTYNTQKHLFLSIMKRHYKEIEKSILHKRIMVKKNI